MKQIRCSSIELSKNMKNEDAKKNKNEKKV